MFFHVFRMFDLHLTNFRQLTSPLNYRPTACATVFLQIFDWNLMWNNGIAPSIFWGIASRYARKCLIENVKKNEELGGATVLEKCVANAPHRMLFKQKCWKIGFKERRMELVHKNDNCFRNCVTTMKTIYHSLFFILYEHLINMTNTNTCRSLRACPTK